MIVVLAILWGLLLAWLTGGDLSLIGRRRIHHEGLVVGLFLAQGLARGVLRQNDVIAPWVVTLWGLCCLVLIFVLLRSASVPGVAVLVLGLAANLLVTLVNQGMPYASLGGRSYASDAFYHGASRATVLWWLGDVLPDPSMGLLLSAGDMLLLIGLVTVLVSGSVRCVEFESEANDG